MHQPASYEGVLMVDRQAIDSKQTNTCEFRKAVNLAAYGQGGLKLEINNYTSAPYFSKK